MQYNYPACVQRAAHGFQPQMKLEAVDKRSPGLIRVATVEEVDTHRIKVAPHSLLYGNMSVCVCVCINGCVSMTTNSQSNGPMRLIMRQLKESDVI